MEEVANLLKTYIAENILFSDNGYPYQEQDSFLENGIVDSINILEIVMFIEERFDFTIDDSELVPENFDSIKKLSVFIKKKTENHQ